MWQRIDRWAIPIMGLLIAQESIARIFASTNKSQATKMSLLAGMGLFIGFGRNLSHNIDRPLELQGPTNIRSFNTGLGRLLYANC